MTCPCPPLHRSSALVFLLCRLWTVLDTGKIAEQDQPLVIHHLHTGEKLAMSTASMTGERERNLTQKTSIGTVIARSSVGTMIAGDLGRYQQHCLWSLVQSCLSRLLLQACWGAVSQHANPISRLMYKGWTSTFHHAGSGFANIVWWALGEGHCLDCHGGMRVVWQPRSPCGNFC